ncbi:MAG: hypothetical protein AAB332_07575 [Planctomycetota bacterium]
MGVELVSNTLAYHGSVDVLTKKTQQDATQSANVNAAVRNLQNINKNNVREVKPSENNGKGARTGVDRDKVFKQNRGDSDGDSDSPGARLDVLL